MVSHVPMSLQPIPPAASGRESAHRVGEPLRIAGRLVEPSLHRITGPEAVTTVEPKLMQVLLCLARAPGSVVSKEEILREVYLQRGTCPGNPSSARSEGLPKGCAIS
jgi:hypothetical protein